MYLLSVIIPVYNAAAWLEECLDSITRSVGAAAGEVELLLINDGSGDGSGEICDRYGARHPHVRVFHKENGGVSTARNLGLAQAKGRYLAWVDPDDYVSEEWFPRIREAIDRGEPDVIVMDSVRFGDGLDRQEVYGRKEGSVDRDLFVADVLRDIRMLSGMPNKVMKAHLFEGITFDTSLPILEDYAAIPEILKRAQTVYYVPRCLYFYRQHPKSLLHAPSTDRAFASVQIAMEREQTTEEKFRAAGVTAVAVQALCFCRNRYVHPDFNPPKKQLQFCTSYVRSHLNIILRDPEVPRMWKVKFSLLALGLYGLFVRLREKQVH